MYRLCDRACERQRQQDVPGDGTATWHPSCSSTAEGCKSTVEERSSTAEEDEPAHTSAWLPLRLGLASDERCNHARPWAQKAGSRGSQWW